VKNPSPAALLQRPQKEVERADDLLDRTEAGRTGQASDRGEHGRVRAHRHGRQHLRASGPPTDAKALDHRRTDAADIRGCASSELPRSEQETENGRQSDGPERGVEGEIATPRHDTQRDRRQGVAHTAVQECRAHVRSGVQHPAAELLRLPERSHYRERNSYAAQRFPQQRQYHDHDGAARDERDLERGVRPQEGPEGTIGERCAIDDQWLKHQGVLEGNGFERDRHSEHVQSELPGFEDERGDQAGGEVPP